MPQPAPHPLENSRAHGAGSYEQVRAQRVTSPSSRQGALAAWAKGLLTCVVAAQRDAAVYFLAMLGAALIAGAITAVACLIPLIGPLLVAPPMVCGLWALTLGMTRGEGVRFGRLFDGFSVFGQALGVVLLFDAMGFVFGLLFWALALHGVIASNALTLLLTPFAVLVPAYLGFRLVFAIPLVVDRKQSIGEALSTSWRMTAGAFHATMAAVLLYLLLTGACIAAIVWVLADAAASDAGGRILGMILLGGAGYVLWTNSILMVLARLYDKRLGALGLSPVERQPNWSTGGAIGLGALAVLGIICMGCIAADVANWREGLHEEAERIRERNRQHGLASPHVEESGMQRGESRYRADQSRRSDDGPAFVTTQRARLKVGNRTLTLVDKGTVVRPVKTNGHWVQVTVRKGRKEYTGWLHDDSLAPLRASSDKDRR